MMDLFTMFDSGSEVGGEDYQRVTMVLELATVLLGAFVGALAVLYAAPKGYLGHRKTKSSATTTIETFAPAPETVPEVPYEAPHAEEFSYAAEAPKAPEPVVAEPSPEPAPSFYESVQPAPAPVTYSAPAPASFSAPTFAKKPVRTYRRRTAPVRSSVGTKPKAAKPKKR